MPPRERRDQPEGLTGSALSRKQIARSVLNGQQVTCTSAGIEVATGYVFGMDDFHWAVVSPGGETTLVHKAGTHVKIHPDHTYDGLPEDQRETLEPMIRPFRDFVSKSVFGRSVTSLPA